MQLVDKDHPILHKASTPVDEALLADNGTGLKPIAALLIDKIYAHNAVGISACQLGMDLAIFAIITEGQTRICANPQIVAALAEMRKDDEGCLSFPGLYLKVLRPYEVIVRYHNEHGKEVTEKIDGFTARAWLHEYDHTMGICYTDRVSKLALDMATRKLNKQRRRIRK